MVWCDPESLIASLVVHSHHQFLGSSTWASHIPLLNDFLPPTSPPWVFVWFSCIQGSLTFWENSIEDVPEMQGSFCLHVISKYLSGMVIRFPYTSSSCRPCSFRLQFPLILQTWTDNPLKNTTFIRSIRSCSNLARMQLPFPSKETKHFRWSLKTRRASEFQVLLTRDNSSNSFVPKLQKTWWRT